jgi:hypothetical protein
VRAGSLTCIAEGKNARDLREREAGRLSALGEVQPADDGRVVVSIPVELTMRSGQEPLLFVETNGLTMDAEGIGDFSNEHEPSLTFDLEAHFTVYGRRMDITLQYFDGCPNWKVADERLTTLAEGNPGMVVTRHIVDTVEEAERVGFRGSPSILINGIDPFARAGDPIGLSCRRYLTPDGYAGAPTVEQLKTVLLIT